MCGHVSNLDLDEKSKDSPVKGKLKMGWSLWGMASSSWWGSSWTLNFFPVSLFPLPCRGVW